MSRKFKPSPEPTFSLRNHFPYNIRAIRKKQRPHSGKYPCPIRPTSYPRAGPQNTAIFISLKNNKPLQNYSKYNYYPNFRPHKLINKKVQKGPVFPIIRSSGAKGFTEYQSALSAYNKALRSIAARVGLAKSGLTTLSSYTARHTWATQAYHAGIPVSVISEGMGHSTEKVTRIYLAQLTPNIIDRYNHSLLHSIGFH